MILQILSTPPAWDAGYFGGEEMLFPAEQLCRAPRAAAEQRGVGCPVRVL